MKWVSQDLKRYTQAKEYVDTIIMPLIPFQIAPDEDANKKAIQNESLSIISNEIEKELSGRVMLLPNYYYIKSAEKDSEITRLNVLSAELSKQPFTHTFFITFDMDWKRYEKDLDSHLLWFPSVQSEDLESKEVVSIIRDQVLQICELIRSYW
ncbi:YpiF family protein [Virgibacillus sp. MSJ-26]|uniref:DUF2487 family protein n=1 Tax=Virgibacillus sp. MSJ-26 TaxID=2841522 RepID=UPI001C113257|nr:DUF2487 family protein [Virgibacillus sp. MSJ-26]MBU5466596.1 YpiF family protein [Virgibacillus sp. MSJ-26]